MTTWKIAGVQMDCRLGDKAGNLDAILARLREAAGQGARLIVFPECALTGYAFESKAEAWPAAAKNPRFVVPTRALENHVYYAAVNRVGEERGFRFIGQSRILDCGGDLLAASDGEEEAILYATVEPARARNKRLVIIPGKYE